MSAAAIIGGILTGIALGLTGGGGTMLALPLLHEVVGLPLTQATTTSLATVGVLSAAGAVVALASRDAQPVLALVFAAAGWAGAPVGAWLHAKLPEAGVLVLFCMVAAAVAARLWRGASDPPLGAVPRAAAAPACPLTGGRVDLTSRCGRGLVASGFAVGVLSGTIGVGGGFLIVPALLRLSGMPMRAAVGTSLMIVALISGAGLVSHLALGHHVDVGVAGPFIGGGLAGLAGGAALVRHLPQRGLQRGFAILLVAVAAALLVRLVFDSYRAA